MQVRRAVVPLLMYLTEYAASIKCAECDYLPHTSISGIRTCPENCFGQVCFIVVNNYYNETLTSGCVNVDDDMRAFFRGHAYCYRKKRYTVCGCTTLDRCNSPQAPFSMFTFISTPFFEDCEFVPKYEDEDPNFFQFNVTMQGNKQKTELIPKAEVLEQPESTSRNESSPSAQSVGTTQTGGGANANAEAVVQTADIGNPPTIVTERIITPFMVTYPISSIETVHDKDDQYRDYSDEISGKFIDEVLRNLLPSTAYQQQITNAAANYYEFKGKQEIVNGHDGSGHRYGLCKIAILLTFAVVAFLNH